MRRMMYCSKEGDPALGTELNFPVPAVVIPHPVDAVHRKEVLNKAVLSPKIK